MKIEAIKYFSNFFEALQHAKTQYTACCLPPFVSIAFFAYRVKDMDNKHKMSDNNNNNAQQAASEGLP